jgi:hypothetical protein
MSGRCDCCNSKLSPYEMTLKHAHTGMFIGTCLSCLKDLNIPMFGRDDLDPYETDDDDAQDNLDEGEY